MATVVDEFVTRYVFKGDPRPPWYIRTGLALYDLLSPRKVSPWHSSFSERELQRFEPSILNS